MNGVWCNTPCIFIIKFKKLNYLKENKFISCNLKHRNFEFKILSFIGDRYIFSSRDWKEVFLNNNKSKHLNWLHESRKSFIWNLRFVLNISSRIITTYLSKYPEFRFRTETSQKQYIVSWDKRADTAIFLFWKHPFPND